MPLYECLIFISHKQQEQYHTSAVFVTKKTSANVILYSSVIIVQNLNTILCVLFNFANENITYKAKAELLCISEQHSGV